MNKKKNMINLKKKIVKLKSSHSLSEARKNTRKRSKMCRRDAVADVFDPCTAIYYQGDQLGVHKKKDVYVEEKATKIPIKYKERSPDVPPPKLVSWPPQPISAKNNFLISETPDRSTSTIKIQYANDTDIIWNTDKSKKRLKKDKYVIDTCEEWITTSNIIKRKCRYRSNNFNNLGDRELESNFLQSTKDITQNNENYEDYTNVLCMKYMLNDANRYYDVEKTISNQQLARSAHPSNVALELPDRKFNIYKDDERSLQTFDKLRKLSSKQYCTMFPNENEKYTNRQLMEMVSEQLMDMVSGQLVEYYQQKPNNDYKESPKTKRKSKSDPSVKKNKKTSKTSKPSKKKSKNVINKEKEKRKEPVEKICEKPKQRGWISPSKFENKQYINYYYPKSYIVIPKEKSKPKRKASFSSISTEHPRTPVSAIEYYTADISTDYSDNRPSTVSILSKYYV